MPTTYKQAGVDQAAKDSAIDGILRMMRRTYDPGVLELPWGFAGLYSLKTSSLFDRAYKHPVLVSCTDGVGTKLRIAQKMGKHDTVGIDLVAMSVNDLLCTGGKPLFFLDYIALGKADPGLILALAKGVTDGCVQAGCALLGGETAEMPGVYPEGEYDLAGFAVGIVEKSKILDGSTVRPGDEVVALPSSGLHSNGFSLVRKILEGRDLNEPFGGARLGDVLLRPTRIYAKAVGEVLKRYKVKKAVKAIANVTGGGIVENLPRVLPAGCAVEIREGAWSLPPIFGHLERLGEVPRDEMYRVFNMGVGMLLVVSPYSAAAIVKTLRRCGEAATVVGTVVKGATEVRILPKE
ncbi:MAG: phosphoribosylformylglycinamidine cyclo-ligase [Planctomycetes bacterium]|nr:phosphoribosylformylglycinamidine cyclo-ligase [Planctomycetota bacterium]